MANPPKTLPPQTNYPHVVNIPEHNTQSAVRLLWDQVYTHRNNLDSQLASIQAAQASIASIQATQSQLVTDVQQLNAAAKITTPTPTTATSPTPPPVGGPPGSPGPPVTGKIHTTDDIVLSTATILNSPPVATWAQTSTMTTFDFNVNGAAPDFDKRTGGSRWPDVLAPGFAGPLQYTLWIFLNINGVWYGSGVIMYWFNAGAPVRNGGPPAGVAANWYFDPARWSPMTGHQPAVGEKVGFMLSAGAARNIQTVTSVAERTQVVVIPFPNNDGCIYTTI